MSAPDLAALLFLAVAGTPVGPLQLSREGECDFIPVQGERCAFLAASGSQHLLARVSAEGPETRPRVEGAGPVPWKLGLRTAGLFVDGPKGIEQGWTIEERPEGAGALCIDVELSGCFGLRDSLRGL